MLAAPEKDWIVSWQGDITKQASEIEVPAALAEALQLSQGDQVSIDVVEGCHAATLVYLEAASKDDYDVVETEAELLTKSILQQMKAVRQGDIIPIWIRGKSSARVRVLSTSPACEVLLTNDTIVSIKPPDAAGNLISKVDDSNVSDADKVANMLNGVNGNTKPKRVTGPLRLRVLVCSNSTCCFSCLLSV
jgi:antitoxin component of MazEF toxin-antitoxin module